MNAVTSTLATGSVVPLVIPPSTLLAWLRANPAVRLLDVRTPGEFQSAHIAGAYNVPLDTLAEHATEIRSAADVQIVLVCQSGQRALKAEGTLRQLGMSNLHLLDGGVNAWLAAGQGVVNGVARVSLERQVRIAAGAIGATGALLALFVNPLFSVVPAFVGSGLVFAGLTDSCAMGMLLARLPYNRAASCDVGAVARALASSGYDARTSP
ncbi:MAG: rhodanese-like domain-containing protein [Gemmatimonadaceae bacterium]